MGREFSDRHLRKDRVDGFFRKYGRGKLYGTRPADGSGEPSTSAAAAMASPLSERFPLESMAKVVKPSKLYPKDDTKPMLAAVLTALAAVVETGVLIAPFAAVPTPQQDQWDAGVAELHRQLGGDGVLSRATVHAACQLLYPMHRREGDKGRYKPMCMLLDLRRFRRYNPAKDRYVHSDSDSESDDDAGGGGGGKPKYMYLVENTSERSKNAPGTLYLQLLLGWDADKQPVFEYLHRLVLWAYVGPPLVEVDEGGELSWTRVDEAVCMHLCDNACCACARHLYWGTRAANFRGDPVEYYDMVISTWNSRYGIEGKRLPGNVLPREREQREEVETEYTSGPD